VLLGVNMQTSFMHPPFGFALFYLRSVAPTKDYLDRVSRKVTKGVTTGQIYWGAVPFVVIQVIMVSMVIAFPQMVMVYKSGEKQYDINKIQIIVPEQQTEPSTVPGGGQVQQAPGGSEQEQAEEALQKALGGGPADASKAPDAPAKAAPDAQSGAAPGASQQDEDAKALERAMRPPSSDAPKDAAPK
jgi:hypothetical protein